jgi:hypothetical protein
MVHASTVPGVPTVMLPSLPIGLNIKIHFSLREEQILQQFTAK